MRIKLQNLNSMMRETSDCPEQCDKEQAIMDDRLELVEDNTE